MILGSCIMINAVVIGKGICLELDDFKVKDLTTVMVKQSPGTVAPADPARDVRPRITVLGGSVMVEQVMRRIKGLPGSSHEAGTENGCPVA